MHCTIVERFGRCFAMQLEHLVPTYATIGSSDYAIILHTVFLALLMLLNKWTRSLDEKLNVFLAVCACMTT